MAGIECSEADPEISAPMYVYVLCIIYVVVLSSRLNERCGGMMLSLENVL